MMTPPGWGGVAFSESRDGDLRNDRSARASFSHQLGIHDEWATVRQVHGDRVVEASEPGTQGDADGIWTRRDGLPIAIFTADCFAVAALAPGAVGVAHAGWRGAAAGVVDRLIDAMTESGHRPEKLAIGPGIGPCCFEVGPDVSGQFPENQARTTWATGWVDLRGYLVSRAPVGIEVWTNGQCTKHQAGWFSHRGTGTSQRMAAVGWM
jgi:YfiH family protein